MVSMSLTKYIFLTISTSHNHSNSINHRSIVTKLFSIYYYEKIVF